MKSQISLVSQCANVQLLYCHITILWFTSSSIFPFFWIIDLRYRKLSFFTRFVLIENLRFVCFEGKPCVNIVSHVFQCLVALAKISQRKLSLVNRLSMAYFKILFSTKLFWKITLSHSMLN